MTDYWKKITVTSENHADLGGNLRHGDTNCMTPIF